MFVNFLLFDFFFNFLFVNFILVNPSASMICRFWHHILNDYDMPFLAYHSHLSHEILNSVVFFNL